MTNNLRPLSRLRKKIDAKRLRKRPRRRRRLRKLRKSAKKRKDAKTQIINATPVVSSSLMFHTTAPKVALARAVGNAGRSISKQK